MFFDKPKLFPISRPHAVIQGCCYHLSLIYQPFLSHFCIFLFDMLKISLRALVSNNFASCVKKEALCFKWLKFWILVQHFSCQKSKMEVMVSTVSIVCKILCSNVWFVWNNSIFGSLRTCKPYSAPTEGQFIHVCHALVWTAHDIHKIIHHYK